jgi:hypothetical protein
MKEKCNNDNVQTILHNNALFTLTPLAHGNPEKMHHREILYIIVAAVLTALIRKKLIK